MDMKRILSIAILSIMLVFGGCRASKPTISTPVIVHNNDSIRIEYVERIVTDTVFIKVPIPQESASQISGDSVSHLETSVAYSDAWLYPNGALGHILVNKSAFLPAEIPVQHKLVESNSSSASVREIPVPYPEYVEVERDFSVWEKFRLDAFWYLVGGIIISIGWIFRKSMFAALIRLI